MPAFDPRPDYDVIEDTIPIRDTRMRILRQIFFEYSAEKGFEVRTKDEKRVFSEAQRIKIYRDDDGLCQACIAEGKPDAEAKVSWAEYEADHVLPHALRGQTDTENGQVLCSEHNRRKGKRVTSG
jgi:hypothetical protein